MKNLISLLVAGAFFWLASCSSTARSTDPAREGNSNGKGEQKNTLKVMAYNVHHCNPPSKKGEIDVGAIALVIKAQEPDLVALQEVDVRTKRSGPTHQAEELAKRLNMHFFFGKAIDYEGGEYGVAILSKYPLSETTVNRLPSGPDTNGEPRVMATAKVILPGGTAIRFGSTHLDAQKDPGNRKMQLEEIAKITTAEKLPFVLAGDFNATPGSAEIKLLDRYFTRTCQACAPTIPVVNPTKAIDFIAFTPSSKFSVSEHQVLAERYASDHLPVVAVLTLKK